MPGWLVPPRQQLLTPNRYQAGGGAAWRVRPVEAVVLHATVGYGGEGTARYLANQALGSDGKPLDARASAHFVVGRSGQLWQLAPLTDRCWHAGGADWRGKGANPCTIGIEIANLGPLFRQGGRWIDWWGKGYSGPISGNPIPLLADRRDAPGRSAEQMRSDLIREWCEHAGIEAPAVEPGGRATFAGLAWEPFQAEQLRTVQWLVGALADLFPVLRQCDGAPGEASRICGHGEIDPSRKLDPGPAFPLQSLRDQVQG